jgi:hypothetical protein
MTDDWRLRVDLHEHGPARALTERLAASELEHDLEASFHDRVVVSRDGNEVFVYTGGREQADGAGELIESLASEHGWTLEIELMRWHPDAEEWRDPAEPLPASDAERAAERAALIEQERREAAERGYPEFEVRVECQTPVDAAALSERLRAEGLTNIRRSSYLLVGAADEDTAKALSERLRDEAPAGCTVIAEGTPMAGYAARPQNPFAVLGGFGG